MIFHQLSRLCCHQQCQYIVRSLRYASTVYALSSGQGKCGVAVVRVTGDKARDVFTCMTLPRTLPEPRKATLRRIIHPNTGEGLDHGLVLWFPGPRSFTGEDSCELQIHGGSAVVTAVISSLSALQGFHPAKPGDFTKRAFYNGKLDLTAVEGLGDLIHAETEAQRKQAFRQMEGALAKLYMGWRDALLFCRANLEAYIDFSEDENIEDGVVAEVEEKIFKLIGEMRKHLADERRGERLRSGLHLAILGRPNTGKSSFLNALVQRPAAIVSSIPGTTRDIIETSLDLGGYPVVISDTAGLHKTDDIIESEGIERALERAKHVDVAVILLEATEILNLLKAGVFEWESFLKHYFLDIGILEILELEWFEKKNYVILINKIDLVTDQDRQVIEHVLSDVCCILSLKTHEGFESSLHKLKEICASQCEVGTEENPVLTSARHRTHIISCLNALLTVVGSDSQRRGGSDSCNESDIYKSDEERLMRSDITSKGSSSPIFFEDLDSKNLLHSEETLLLAAHHLQRATNSLGQVTGQVTTEDVLDQIFSAFCIGK
ncbi:tRNA modification GTPase GTPBP3, mitochondrial-like [Penaeus chinensis]|uniref:tRNA modification GTPase GTPBP3, mitochondrial-like n=1 Tax=Penaeus chinensis TaxID=139456 RepID=UPI001FB650B5|nr:tRNA modification GTPase GTPBP3, mitochondrial-like [Penaeus chinensis]